MKCISWPLGIIIIGFIMFVGIRKFLDNASNNDSIQAAELGQGTTTIT